MQFDLQLFAYAAIVGIASIIVVAVVIHILDRLTGDRPARSPNLDGEKFPQKEA